VVTTCETVASHATGVTSAVAWAAVPLAELAAAVRALCRSRGCAWAQGHIFAPHGGIPIGEMPESVLRGIAARYGREMDEALAD
jgi:hypothetical protein